MKLRVILSAIPLLSVLACGSDHGMFSLSSGTYGLSSTSAAATDDCNVGAVYPDGTNIQIAVSGTNATFAFGPVDPNKNPVAAIQGNTISQGSKTFDVDDRTFQPPQYADCVETITETVSGSLLADDQVQGALLYTSVKKTGFTGTGCTATNLGYKVFPYASTLSFTAKKK